ncbi:MAG: DUF1624 domain-containing protein [Chitinophagales bacterium]|nr:DUF1624 domain-containing protein [Chitinophagales bacterium]
MTISNSRIRSIDILRGAAMVLMALDHVRVYSGVPGFSAETGAFLTRWETHFCAPGFAFLAGTAIFLHQKKLNNIQRLSRFLITRGLLLVILEITLIRFCWTFNFDYSKFFLAGVIWMLGWCLVSGVNGIAGKIKTGYCRTYRYCHHRSTAGL